MIKKKNFFYIPLIWHQKKTFHFFYYIKQSREQIFFLYFIIINMTIQNILPVIWIFGSLICFVIMQFLIKLLSDQISIQYIVCLRSILLLLFNSYFIFASQEYQPYKQSLPKQNNNIKYFSLNIKNRKYFQLMLKRLFWNALSVNTFLGCLKYVNLSIANALVNTTPVLNFFVQAAYFKKSIKPISLVISMICFIGIMIILDPMSSLAQQQQFNWFIILPLISAFSNSLSWIYLHQMRSQFKEIMVLQYAYIAQLFTSAISMIIFGNVQSEQEVNQNIFWSIGFYVFMGMIVLLAYATHYLRVLVTFKRKPSQILAYNYFGIIFSIFVDVFFSNSHLQFMTIIGILLTGAGLLSQLVLNLLGKEIQHN